MRCYYHPDQEAVGICKNCQRGLCANSVAEIGDSIACRGVCEDKVAKLNALMESAPARQARGVVFTVGAGMIFAAFGVVAFMQDIPALGVFTIAMGALYGAFGIWNFMLGRRRVA